jgi:hypothetical protein
MRAVVITLLAFCKQVYRCGHFIVFSDNIVALHFGAMRCEVVGMLRPHMVLKRVRRAQLPKGSLCMQQLDKCHNMHSGWQSIVHLCAQSRAHGSCYYPLALIASSL